MNMSRFLLGLFGVGVAAFFYINALGYPRGAAQMPLIYSVVVAVLSSMLMIQEVRKLKWMPSLLFHDTGQPGNEEGLRSGKRMVAAFSVFALAVVYIFVIEHVGYLISTVAFMFSALLIIRTVTVKFALIGVAVMVAVISFVFLWFLGLSIPLLPTFV